MLERKSLSGIDWTIQKGQTVGIVGRTGAGKTSLVRQFLRQYPVGEGEFLVNQQPIVDYNRHSIEEKSATFPKNIFYFSKSIRENIALGKNGANEEELVEAVAQAAFADDLERMSHGMDTMIGEKGVSVSGGQKQRISLARAS